MITHFLLVRHGQSVSNKNKVFAGQNDMPLSDLGEAQSEALARKLKDEKIDYVYSSSLSRAYYTAMPTARQKGLCVCGADELREVYFAEWENKSTDYLTANGSDYPKWKERTAKYCSEHGETPKEAGLRFENALKALVKKREGKTILVACHGGIINDFLCRIGYFDYETADHDCVPRNASVTRVDYDGESFSVKSFSELPDGKQDAQPGGDVL